MNRKIISAIVLIGIPPLCQAANVAPSVSFLKTELRPGTTLMDVDYQVNDPDDETVELAICAFKNGVRSFANFIKVETLVEGTQASVGGRVPTGVVKRVTWDVGVDWGVDNGAVSVCIMPKDKTGFLRFDWITIPAGKPTGQPELTASTNSVSDEQLLPIAYWFMSKGELYWTGEQLVSRTGYRTLSLVSSAGPESLNLLGRTWLYQRMDVGFLLPDELQRMQDSQAGFSYAPWFVKKGFAGPTFLGGNPDSIPLDPSGEYIGAITNVYSAYYTELDIEYEVIIYSTNYRTFLRDQRTNSPIAWKNFFNQKDLTESYLPQFQRWTPLPVGSW